MQIDSCYNAGPVSGQTDVGGILGSHRKLWGTDAPGRATITNSYNIGVLTGTTHVGGIIGNDSGGNFDISTSYYLQTGSLQNVGSIANNTSCARTEEYMKSAEFVTLLGTNFMSDSTPPVNNGYPILTP